MNKVNFSTIKTHIPEIKAEIPEPKRCCFCIPLRYGLLVWGYIKLLLSLLVFLFGALVLQMYTQLIFFAGSAIIPYIGAGMLMLLFLMIDIGMTIAFLVGGHQKTTRLMRVFYIYSIVLLVVSSLLFIVYNCVTEKYDVHDRRYRIAYERYLFFYTSEIVLGVVFICVQSYIVILLRSEINKLRRQKNFRFSNRTLELEAENGNVDPGLSQNQQDAREVRNNNQLGHSSREDSEGNSFRYAQF